jgi:hypothetical protein
MRALLWLTNGKHWRMIPKAFLANKFFRAVSPGHHGAGAVHNCRYPAGRDFLLEQDLAETFRPHGHSEAVGRPTVHEYRDLYCNNRRAGDAADEEIGDGWPAGLQYFLQQPRTAARGQRFAERSQRVKKLLSACSSEEDVIPPGEAHGCLRLLIWQLSTLTA